MSVILLSCSSQCSSRASPLILPPPATTSDECDVDCDVLRMSTSYLVSCLSVRDKRARRRDRYSHDGCIGFTASETLDKEPKRTRLNRYGHVSYDMESRWCARGVSQVVPPSSRRRRDVSAEDMSEYFPSCNCHRYHSKSSRSMLRQFKN